MKSKKLRHFDSIEEFSEGPSYGLGLVLINDLSNRSDFMFGDWRIPVIRPNSQKCARSLTDALNGIGSKSNVRNEYLDELIRYATPTLKSHDGLVRESFFIAVSFEPGAVENFAFDFSSAANTELLAPVERNFLASGQKFDVSRGQSNTLFSEIEASVPQVSCFRLRFGDTLKNLNKDTYFIERVFEETLIFASLAISKKI